MERSPDTVLDELLILQAQDGDIAALSALVLRWQPRLLRHALRLTNRHDAAADVVQESWLSIARSLRRLNDPACFARWSYQIVSNKSADWIRNQKQQRQLLDKLATENVCPGPQNETASKDGSEVTALQAALAYLSQDQRTLLSLYYQDELPIADIAQILSIPAGTVKSRLHHARHELKQLLERNQP